MKLKWLIVRGKRWKVVMHDDTDTDGEPEPQHDKPLYEGERDALGRPHGVGIMVYSHGDVYRGHWCHGLRHGTGTYDHVITGTRYSGSWRDGKRHGLGTLLYGPRSFFPGHTFDGEWVRGLQHGSGEHWLPNNVCYRGEWVGGDMRRDFTISFPKGHTYQGQLRHGLPHGHGIYQRANGDIYEGHWFCGSMHGFQAYQRSHQQGGIQQLLYINGENASQDQSQGLSSVSCRDLQLVSFCDDVSTDAEAPPSLDEHMGSWRDEMNAARTSSPTTASTMATSPAQTSCHPAFVGADDSRLHLCDHSHESFPQSIRPLSKALSMSTESGIDEVDGEEVSAFREWEGSDAAADDAAAADNDDAASCRLKVQVDGWEPKVAEVDEGVLVFQPDEPTAPSERNHKSYVASYPSYQFFVDIDGLTVGLV